MVEPTPLKNSSLLIGFIFPNFRGENKKYLKPPPRVCDSFPGRYPFPSFFSPEKGYLKQIQVVLSSSSSSSSGHRHILGASRCLGGAIRSGPFRIPRFSQSDASVAKTTTGPVVESLKSRIFLGGVGNKIQDSTKSLKKKFFNLMDQKFKELSNFGSKIKSSKKKMEHQIFHRSIGLVPQDF